jgi:hypothetical protein
LDSMERKIVKLEVHYRVVGTLVEKDAAEGLVVILVEKDVSDGIMGVLMWWEVLILMVKKVAILVW